MRFIRELTPESIKLLKRISRKSKHYQVRERAKCIIFSYQGLSINQLIKIFGVSRKTIYNWFTKWEDEKITGLYNSKGRGRKPKLNKEQKSQLKDWVKKEPKALLKIVKKVQDEWEITISKETIKRIIKKLKMKWKRMKRGLSKEADEWELEVKLPRLRELIEESEKGEIDLRYLDQSGFSLTPYIPYGWQSEKETIILQSRTGKRINVIGLMNRKNELDYEIIKGSIKSQDVINFLDKFSNKLVKKTTVVLDQASIHTSDYFLKKSEEWSQKGLKIFWLPTYSPKLNLIELLWKFIKYEWMEIEREARWGFPSLCNRVVDAYESQKNLVKYLRKVLNNFGSEYVINFV